MALRAGKLVRGATGTYELVAALQAPTVYKARVLSGPRINKTRAVVKTAVGELENVALRREYGVYKIPDIAASPYIRTLYDSIGSFEGDARHGGDAAGEPLCLVFEWMETDLQSVSSRQHRRDSRLPKTISKSVLSALSVFTRRSAVHTDVNPNNIFVSDIDGPSPVVKLGDLGTMIKEGFNNQRLQSLPCRTPEVWQGIGCFHSSDVWSVGVTLAHWLYGRAIFGAGDKIIEDHTEAWCIAELQSLIGKLGPCINYQPYKNEFELADQLASMEIGPGLGKLIRAGTLRQELQALADPPVAPQLLDFIDYLLVVDVARRPTAQEALQHPYLQSS